MNYDEILSKKVCGIKFSGIRKFFDIAASVKDVVSLSVGEPDFKTPFTIRKEAIRTLEKGKTAYTSNSGMELLREQIAGYLKESINVDYDPKHQIIVTVGGSEAIDAAFRAILNPGDEVLVCEPSFVCYSPLITMADGVPVSVETKVENKFRLTPEELTEKITDRTKALVLPYPNNPTGAVMRREDLEKIAAVLKDRNIIVISDEIYSEMTYGGDKHVSIASFDGMAERTIVINGFSKAFAMTGWRLGYAAGPEPIITQMLKIHQYGIMSAPTVSQYAAITALRECREDIDYMVSEYDMRRKLIVNGFNEMGLDCFEPEGAFYVFPCIKSTGLSSQDFCQRLVQEKKVAVVPGDAFGDCGEGYIRVSYAYSINHIVLALKRIKEFINEI